MLTSGEDKNLHPLHPDDECEPLLEVVVGEIYWGWGFQNVERPGPYALWHATGQGLTKSYCFLVGRTGISSLQKPCIVYSRIPYSPPASNLSLKFNG